ncbi:MAG: MarR family transcriptional regulator [Ghiorsea sp.]|nr:MarR family transcriptional regulator [Ghiorsea sp.]
MSGRVISQAEIVGLMMRDKTTVTRRLDGLVKKELIERFPNEKLMLRTYHIY